MTEFYPGSKKTRKTYDGSDPNMPSIPEPTEELNLGKPRRYLVNGQPIELYPLGAVARALNRQPVTIRKWETEGILPRSPYKMPSHDPRGQRRLYSLQQIEDLRKIAIEEGILEPAPGGKWKPIESTQFKEKALRAFKK